MKTFLVFFLLCFAGCGHAPIIHPGAVNSFDSNTYDALITVGAGILQAKSLVAEQFPQFKGEFNKVNQSYRALEDSYKVYHIALTQGLIPNPATLAEQLNKVTTDLTTLLASLGVKK